MVIGGRNSSNTTRLFEICEAGMPPQLTMWNRPTSWTRPGSSGCATVGVTAGASTPESQIAAVCDRLEGF